ncbi:cytochrome P450 [Nonomuraea deserti]|uniref:cytochrome P450 n=1 Tax=Nonomuraea deserti TaxID=1848322 RepID=UPI0014050BAD|nr:cytochrome P450 [Nonomuraea deserti]
MKDPVTELARMGVEAEGRVVRLDLGPFRPYLISHPDHVQQVLKTDWTNFVREGMFWRPVQRVTGDSILGEGDGWASTRKILQPLFTMRYTASLAEDMADIITECIGELDGFARRGQPVDGGHQMTTIVNQAVIKVLFGGRISRDTAERLAPEFSTCATSIGFRLLFPFAPYSIKVPGDRAFLRSAKKIDEIVYPLIEQAKREGIKGKEVVSTLLAARLETDGDADLRQVRDDLVSIYGAASETTAMSLTWLWSVLHDHPDVNARLQDEIRRVVGDGPVRPSHVAELTYLRMVLQELLRVYPSAWIIPRQTVADTEIGGVRIKAGSQVLVSPYTTHRLSEFWDRPHEFDPERWADEKAARRHRFSFIPFGAGPHVCLGQHLFYVEAPLVIANLLSRYEPVLTNPQKLTPVPGASVRPKEKLYLRLLPIERKWVA